MQSTGGATAAFGQIRVQILYPCRGKCAWCSTHPKNALFERLYKNGTSDQVHGFYADAIRRLRPARVMVSGGEPLLLPEAGDLLEDIASSTRQIDLFTSFQFSTRERERMALDEMPTKQLVLCHTLIYFERERWNELTNGFPFDVYLDNVRFFARLPIRKRFKFIINHASIGDEIRRFQELVEPDDTCHLTLKVINAQGGDPTGESMTRTRGLVNERVAALDELVAGAGWGKVHKRSGTVDAMAPLLVDGDVSRCVYRKKPLELRFALDPKTRSGRPVLRYRYCPYFPPDFGHRFHVGRDSLDKLERNFSKGSFRDHCARCRFLAYYSGEPACPASTYQSAGGAV